jgi:hypothetical protein
MATLRHCEPSPLSTTPKGVGRPRSRRDGSELARKAATLSPIGNMHKLGRDNRLEESIPLQVSASRAEAFAGLRRLA